METGEILDDVESIFSFILDYNVQNMSKKVVSDEIKEIQEIKDNLISDLFSSSHKYPQTIPWSIYCKVVQKIMSQNKLVFKEFILSGSKFKLAMFGLINKIYASEKIPESMFKTVLTSIYKKKGDIDNIKHYRFIHGRDMYSKLMEKCIVEIISEHMELNMPEGQIGGASQHSTRDHIMTATCLMRAKEARGLPSIFTLIDIQACFDRTRLNDITYCILNTGADVKATKMAHMLADKSVIQIARDPNKNRQALVEGSAGQGTNLACRGTSLTIGDAVDNAAPIENCDMIIEKPISPREFVDDVLLTNKDPKSARETARMVSVAIDILSLEANTTKSAVMVTGGNNKKVNETRAELTSNPVKLHDKPVELKDKEAYLGFILSKDGFVASVEATIKARIQRAWLKTANIKTILQHPLINSFGWFRAACVLLQATLPPILSYSAETWAGIPKRLIEKLEKAQKDMVYSTLGLPDRTKYSAVLLETGLLRVKHVIQKAQITYMSQVVWQMVGTTVHNTVMEEWECLGEKSTLGQVDLIAISYGMDPVSKSQLHPAYIKQVVRNKHDLECWKECFISPITNVRLNLKPNTGMYMKWEKAMSKALLFWRVGALKFKSLWRQYNLKNGISVKCVMPMCPHPTDNLDHVKECKFYDNKWDPKWKLEVEIAAYIVRISRERFQKVKMPLF